MSVQVIGLVVAVIGMGVVCDGIASLYTYTSGDKAKGQSFWKDHLLRVLRMLYGGALIYLGYLLVV